MKKVLTIIVSLALMAACAPKSTSQQPLPIQILETPTTIPELIPVSIPTTELNELIAYAKVITPRNDFVQEFSLSPDSFEVLFKHCYEDIQTANGDCDESDFLIEGVWMFSGYTSKSVEGSFQSGSISGETGELNLRYGETTMIMVPYEFTLQLPSGDIVTVCAKEDVKFDEIKEPQTIEVKWSPAYCGLSTVN